MFHRRFAGIALTVSTFFGVCVAAFAFTPAKNSAFRGSARGSVTLVATVRVKVPVSFKTSSNGSRLVFFTYTDDFAANPAVKVVLPDIKISGGKFSLTGSKSARIPATPGSAAGVVYITSVTGTFLSPAKVKGSLTYTRKDVGDTGHIGPIALAFTASAT